VTTLASFAWQSAAYLYSLVPFTVLWAIFAARGIVASVEFLWGLLSEKRDTEKRGAALFGLALLALVLVVEVTRARSGLGKLLATNNEAQHELLSRVGRLTHPDEPVFNISGGQVTRPSVHFFYFFEAVVRQLKHDVFAYDLPRALTEEGAVAYMPSYRFERLPEPLRRFLVSHFVPMDDELWFWGQRFSNNSRQDSEMLASRTGRYYVWPLTASADLLINDIPAMPIVELEAGRHRIAYSGTAPEIFVIWLPADEQPFVPRPDLWLQP
jgi:hypothetical protein